MRAPRNADLKCRWVLDLAKKQLKKLTVCRSPPVTWLQSEEAEGVKKNSMSRTELFVDPELKTALDGGKEIE